MALIEDQTFCVGRACDSPRNKPVPFKFARREDDNIASDPQTVKCSVHIYDQTAPFPMDRKDDEKINIAARVCRPARLGTEKDNSLRGETAHKSADGFPECLLVNHCHNGLIIPLMGIGCHGTAVTIPSAGDRYLRIFPDEKSPLGSLSQGGVFVYPMKRT